MYKLTFSDVSIEDIKKCVDLKESNANSEVWTEIEAITLTSQEKQEINIIQLRLSDDPLHLMNDATVWGRAIYPLLLLVEKKPFQAWAEVSLKASYKTFCLEGVADGVLAKRVVGHLEAPYIVILEAKRGIKAKDPIPQLYAQLLAGAKLSHQEENTQRIFGCYTIAGSWTFVQADIVNIETKRPILKTRTSKEYSVKHETETILKILKNILKIYLI